MIKISKQDWERFKRDNNPEIFEAKVIDNWIENNRDLLVKAETSELEGIEKELVDNFRTEISHFTKVEVMGPNPDKLQKGLYCETFYIREQQVEWDETIEKSEDGEDYGFGTFRKTALNDKLGRTGNLIEKGKRGQLGEIREWKGGKYKKTTQGWIPVNEGKKESKEESSEGKDDKKDSSGKVKSEYHIQYKDKWGEVRQKPFVATSIEEAIKMAKEQKIGSDISPSKIPDKTGREEKDQYIKEMESKKESEGKENKKEQGKKGEVKQGTFNISGKIDGIGYDKFSINENGDLLELRFFLNDNFDEDDPKLKTIYNKLKIKFDATHGGWDRDGEWITIAQLKNNISDKFKEELTKLSYK